MDDATRYAINRSHAQSFAAMDADRTLACLASIEGLSSRSAHTFECLSFAFASIGRCVEASSAVIGGL